MRSALAKSVFQFAILFVIAVACVAAPNEEVSDTDSGFAVERPGGPAGEGPGPQDGGADAAAGSATGVPSDSEQLAIADGSTADPEAERPSIRDIETEAELVTLANEAEAAVSRGDVNGALGIINAVLSRRTLPANWEGRFHHLKIRAKRDLAEASILRGVVRLERFRYVIGEVIRGEVVLENISGRAVVIPRSAEVRVAEERGLQSSATYFRRSVTYSEFVPTNTLVTETDFANVRVDEDIRLDVGESFRIPIEIDTSERNLSGTMLRSYRFSCTLHPAEIVVGDEVFNASLLFRDAEVRVFPRNAEHLEESPLARVREAYRKNSPTHLHLAASMVAERDRRELLRFFERKLKAPDCPEPMSLAIMTSLTICSGRADQDDRDGWLTWLKKRNL